jgi:hypothetical protein
LVVGDNDVDAEKIDLAVFEDEGCVAKQGIARLLTANDNSLLDWLKDWPERPWEALRGQRSRFQDLKVYSRHDSCRTLSCNREVYEKLRFGYVRQMAILVRRDALEFHA